MLSITVSLSYALCDRELQSSRSASPPDSRFRLVLRARRETGKVELPKPRVDRDQTLISITIAVAAADLLVRIEGGVAKGVSPLVANDIEAISRGLSFG